MQWLSDLLVGVVSSVVGKIWKIIQHRRLVAEAERARALDAYIQGRRIQEAAEQALLEEASRSYEFSYDNWNAMRDES